METLLGLLILYVILSAVFGILSWLWTHLKPLLPGIFRGVVTGFITSIILSILGVKAGGITVAGLMVTVVVSAMSGQDDSGSL